MCREIYVLSIIENDFIDSIAKPYNIKVEISDIENYACVQIGEINDHCLCDLTDEERIAIFEFIKEISVL